MIFAYPDFYSEFHCIAGDCQHSCCKGWEIDIDDESMERYKRIRGSFGKRLRASISEEPTPHFILTETGCCPFLEKNGLCSMISELGEESLCGICAEHPRFYNEYKDRTEVGLGLCCEEAVRLLMAGTEPLCIVEVDDGEGEREKPEAIIRRERIFAALSDASLPLVERMKRMLALEHTEVIPFAPKTTAEFYEGLERMDAEWGKMLTKLRDAPLTEPEGIRYERMAEYLIYRHFTDEYAGEKAGAVLQFAVLSVRIIHALERLGYGNEALRLYSAEIEYSDENLEKILAFLS